MDRGRTARFLFAFAGFLLVVLAAVAVLVELVFKKYLSRKEGLSVFLIWMTQS